MRTGLSNERNRSNWKEIIAEANRVFPKKTKDAPVDLGRVRETRNLRALFKTKNASDEAVRSKIARILRRQRKLAVTQSETQTLCRP
ncbi:MAG: hypothetical protein AAB573_03855 [Patescibacteria group bacterium]